jgi:hypothetical protein
MANGGYVHRNGNSTITGNLTSTSFIKSGGTNQQVLLANGDSKALAEFGSGGTADLSNYV